MLTLPILMSGTRFSGGATCRQHPRTPTRQPAPVQVHAIELDEGAMRRTTLYAAGTVPQSKPRLSRHVQLLDYESSASEMALHACCRHAGRRRGAYRVHQHPCAEMSCRRPPRHRIS